MALSPGAILFTSALTETDPNIATSTDAFSFIATEPIAAGEEITFHAPESFGDSTFTYTVGANGLGVGDRVTLQEEAGTINILNDPSGGSASTVSGEFWAVSEFDSIVAGSDGDAIAAINIEMDWDLDLSSTGLTRANIDAAIGSNNPSPIIDNMVDAADGNENAMFAGTDISGIDDPANWVFDGTGQNHASPNIAGTTYASQDANIVVCFTAGTLVETAAGPRRIETLAKGDLVITRDRGAQPIRWIGRTGLTAETLRAKPHLRPIRIAAGALGDNARTMVSPAHRMLVTGWRAEALAGEAEVLAPAKSLINDRTITVAHDVDEVVYYHLMFDAHELILADGAWSESFHPATQSLSPATAAEVIALFPEVEQAASSTRLGRAMAAAETVAVLSL